MTLPTGKDLMNVILKFIYDTVSDSVPSLYSVHFITSTRRECQRSFTSQKECIHQDCLFLAITYSYKAHMLLAATGRLFGRYSIGQLNSNPHDHKMNLHLTCRVGWYIKNSVALVRERTIPTEWPPPVDEVSTNF